MIYSGHKKVLDNLNFEIKEGEFFVIVGPSGSGKTTTLKLINRLIEQSEGDIFFNDKKLKDYPLRDLRLDMGYVLQQIALFPNMTVAENIGLIPEMKKMDKKKINEIIDELLENVDLDPKVYKNRLPEDLSGGEKQRISIARCILKNAPIVILDEATASVDVDNESYIQEAISELVKNKTLLVIAHRLNTIRDADSIIVIKEGNIAEQGTHNELIALNGIYKNMVELQEKNKGLKII